MQTKKVILLNQRGVTLIELMVASIILGITTTGVLTMLGSGRNMDIANSLRRQARLTAIAILEDSLYHYSKYAACLPRIDTRTVTLEPAIPSIYLIGDEPTPVPATATITITNDPSLIWAGQATESRTIQVNVAWPAASPTDTVTLVKRITNAK